MEEPRDELRIGLVLYGGVSLAIYMYGIAGEVLRLVRASRGDVRDELDRAYERALREAGIARVTVDVISGTSAGGINGILLAKALTTGASLDAARDLWLETADVDRLLPEDGESDSRSLLDSRLFERTLGDGLDRMDAEGGGPALTEVLDLFVSSTDLRGLRPAYADSFGEPITTREYRRVFQLRYRTTYELADEEFSYERNDFDPAAPPGNARLRKLARATSAFPVAFEPIEIGFEDGILDGKRSSGPGWFADGGILNNRPFTDALATIFTRTSQRPVRRWLLSVDPDPELAEAGALGSPQPAFDEVAGKAIATIPRYQSIAGDLDSLAAHNEAVRRSEALSTALERELARAGPVTAETDGPSYRAMRRQALAGELAGAMLDFVHTSDERAWPLEVVAAGLERAALSFCEADPARAVEIDLAFHRRRAYYLVKLITLATRGAAGAPPPAWAGARSGLWAAFEAARARLWAALDAGETPASLAEIAAADSPDLAAAEDVLGQLTPALRAAAAEVDAMIAAATAGIAIELPAPEDGGPATTADLEAVAAGFELRDLRLLPLELIGGLRERDRVDHARLTPAAARHIGREPARKLAGDALGHFGGFLSRAWRENDLRWGRLDGAEILVRTATAGRPAAPADELVDAVQREIVAQEEPEALAAPEGWRAHLRDRAGPGDETPASLGAPALGRLGIRAGDALAGLLTRTGRDPDARGVRATALRSVGWLLGGALALIRAPVAAATAGAAAARRR